jgi:hypothetical protein
MDAKMKMLGLAVLLLILFSLTFTAVAYSPHRADTLYPRYGTFESMDPMSPEVLNSLPTREHFLNKPSSVQGFSSIPVAEGFEQYTPPSQPVKREPVKVEGFESLLQPANYSQEQSISKFSELKGNVSCVNKSAGLTNSMGGLCLDDSLLKSLTTRGGNSTGANCPQV